MPVICKNLKKWVYGFKQTLFMPRPLFFLILSVWFQNTALEKCACWILMYDTGWSRGIFKISVFPFFCVFNPYIAATQCRRPLIFQTMNSAKSNNLSLKYKRFTLSDCKDIGIGIFETVAKTQFFCCQLESNVHFLKQIFV